MNAHFFIKQYDGDYEDCFLVGCGAVRLLGRYQHFTSQFTKLHMLQKRRKQSSKGFIFKSLSGCCFCKLYELSQMLYSFCLVHFHKS